MRPKGGFTIFPSSSLGFKSYYLKPLCSPLRSLQCHTYIKLKQVELGLVQSRVFFLLFYLVIRRSPFTELYTADQVHLLPGYPSNTTGSLQVAFYVQQPLGLFIGNISVLSRSTLAEIVITHKSALETVIGANISDVEVLFKPATPTTSPTAGPVEPSSNAWKWITIGVVVGVVVIILIVLIVFWW